MNDEIDFSKKKLNFCQVASLQKLEVENEEEAEKLEEIVNKGEELLKTIQKSLEAIATAQLKCQALESSNNYEGMIEAG